LTQIKLTDVCVVHDQIHLSVIILGQPAFEGKVWDLHGQAIHQPL